MIEDDFTYVLRKALTGNGLSSAQAAVRAGISEMEVDSFLGGRFSEAVARKLATVLGLDADAYAVRPSYLPQPLKMSNVERVDLPFEEERVNAWLIREGGTCILFDAGFVAADLLGEMKSRDASSPDLVLITHGHCDHIGALHEILDAGLTVRSSGVPGTITMAPGETLQQGPLSIRACDLSGHFTPSLGFHVEGLAKPVLVVGDALFAGSIGKCATPEIYEDALERLRRVLAPLPDDTILLPGHGPATTLGEERVSNPFL